MRRQRQSVDSKAEGSQQAPRVARVPRTNGSGGSGAGTANPLLGFMNSAGNAATAAALRQRVDGMDRPAGLGKGKGRPVAPAAGIDERAEAGLVLPPYLMALEAGGLSTSYGLTGHEFVKHAVAAAVGHAGRDVAGIAAELAGRPESFFGSGRAFAVRGATGKEWFDVTVTISPDSGDRPPAYHPKKDLAVLPADPDGPPVAELDDAEGKETKVDVQHNSAATTGSTAGSSSSKGVGGMGFGLAPVVPGLWLGGAGTGNVQPWQSSRESRSQKSVAEPRVLRSDKGTVEVPRKVRFGVRVQKSGTQDAQTFRGSGTLKQRVPTEHLIPAGTGELAPPRPVEPPLARRVSLADSMAPVAVADAAAPHQGGGGLFDAVASVMHPSVTAPGAPGRTRLYAATASATVLEDMPRLLRDGVVGEDLHSKDGGTAASYHLHAEITGLTPAWRTGGTQLRTHQQAQHTAAASAGKGRAVTAGLGPAIGVGAAGNAAVVRGTAMPVGAARKARFSQSEQTVSTRQGAEVRGEKVLYQAVVRFTAKGTGPGSAAMVLNPANRISEHSMKVWVSLRADEAAEFGLPLPPGATAGDFIKRPKRRDDAGKEGSDGGDGSGRVDGEGRENGSGRENGEGAGEQDVVRHLPFTTGSSVVLSQVDTGPMVRAVRELFATDPQLAGYLPVFGAAQPSSLGSSKEDAAAQRDNYRELMAALSETNLKVNKAQLLSTGIPVRLRRKTTLHAHDVLIRVRGSLGETRYLGDIKDWMVRSHSGVASTAQSGRSSARSIGGLVLGQVRLAPGVLTGSARYEKHQVGTRRNQAGPTTRTDTLTNGSEDASAFGAALRLDVNVSMTSRPRKLARSLTPGAPGRSVPEARAVAEMQMDEQDVRLLTPTEFTLDDDGKRRQEEAAARRTGRPAAPEREFNAAGIGDLAGLIPRPATGRPLRDWQLTESLGDGSGIRDLAFQLLSRAAGRNKALREDPALATEGLAPRLAIEERFSPQAVNAAVRQATSSGWVVKDLRYQRRTAALNGAVGTRLTLANPKFLHRGAGPGTETLALGGHQAGGQQGNGTSSTVQFGMTASENFAEGRTGQGMLGYRTRTAGGTDTATISGTVERNAHTPKKAPLYLVQCDLLVNMVAEVKVTGGGPYVAKAVRTLPAEAAVWLTEAQLPPSIRRQLKLDEEPAAKEPVGGTVKGKEPAGTETGTKKGKERAGARTEERDAAESSSTAAARTAPPTLDRRLPLGFGMVEGLPNFVPLLEMLRGRLAQGKNKGLADDLLPRQQLKDRNDNVQRLLRVLDRSGSAGLLSGAMDGGVTVELLDGRKTPHWAVFKVDRVRDGAYEGTADDGRDMEYITSAVAQQAGSQGQGVTKGAAGVFAGSGKPDSGVGQLKSLGGAAGAGFATSSSRRTGDASRGQLGVKAVAEAKSTQSAKMRVPVRASLELHSAAGRVAMVALDNLAFTHRVPAKDLAALARVTPLPTAAPVAAGPRGAAPARLGPWREAGVRLPMEAQVNGFQGAPRVRELVSDAVRAAGGGDRFRDKGQAAAYTLNEAVSTEWMIAALPLLTSAGVDLPPVHASGAEGQDLHASLHARLRQGRVLGVGDKMTFETVGQSTLESPRPTQADGVSTAEQSRSGRALGGAGLLNAEEFRLNQMMADSGGTAGGTGTAANAAGSMPLHKPKMSSVLVQFTLDVRVTAQVTNRVRGTRAGTAEREMTLPQPVVIRMPEPMVRRMVATAGAELQDPDNHLGVKATPPPPPAP
ncbi:hypothetical protein [Streptomyces sp. CA-111067]|uniref:hypothetical protein n=1 Tax=Streptomyces sp. CA-111067 TaxID=3240046 RepID=UPI003D99271D